MKHYLSLKNVWVTLFMLTFVTTIYAQTPPWNAPNTGVNHTVLIPPGTVTINSSPISVGDAIGAFFDSAGVAGCGGWILYDGTMTALSIWGAEAGVDNGFQTGEAFNWKVWIASTGTIVDMVATYQVGAFPNLGTYSTNGMSGLATLTGTMAGNSLSASFTSSDVSCYAVCDGSIDVTASDGTPPYSYAWSTGATDEDLSGLCAGAYTVTVSDAVDNEVLNITINEPGEILLSGITTNTTCFGDATGAINLTVAGGASPYAFAWSNNSSTEDLSGLIAGTYTVTVTDDNGCTNTNIFTIAEPAILDATVVETDVLCYGDATGSVDLTVSGGSLPYAITWSNGAFTENLTNVVAGTYGYTVTDANSCTFAGSAAVTEPTAISVTNVLTNVNCFGNQNGAIDLTISGGVSPYNIIWSNSATTEDLAGLGPGNYEVLIFDTHNCSFTDLYTISEPAEFLATAVLSDYSGFNVSVNGASDGSIDVSVTGGISPYTFSWSNGATTEDLSNLTAGTYDLTVSDANTCLFNDSYTLTEPAIVSFGATGSVTDASCFGVCNGAIDLIVSGGISPYTYMWSNSATTEDLSGLCAGTYDVTVTDASGGGSVYQPFDWTYVNTGSNHTVLISTNVVTINGSPLQAGDVIGVFYDAAGVATCAGYIEWNGSSTACTAWGSEPGLNNGLQANEAFGWKVWRAVQGDIVDMTATYEPLFPNQGNYITNGMSGLNTLTGTASGGGGGGGSTTTASFVVSEPAELLVNGTATNNLCFGDMLGSIDLTVAGGTSPYLFNWSNSASTEDISGLGAGYYDVIVSDANQCSTTFGVTIAEPTELMATASATDILCYGYMTGSIDLSVSGGTIPYSFNWDNSEMTEDISSLAAGTYSVTVTDDNGCIFMTSATINQPSELVAGGMAIDVSCFGGSDGSIDLTVSGGVAPYTYMWSNSAQTEDLSGLAANNYGYTVTDANGCMVVGSVLVNQPNNLEATGEVSDYSGYSISLNGASDGWINLTVMGGTTPYSYMWSNGATLEDLSNLPAGAYGVTVTDNNGCFDELSFTLTQPDPSVTLQISAVLTHNVCFGGAIGTIDLSISGGTAPYFVEWSNSATAEDLSGLVAGTYWVTVTDQGSNTETGSFTISEPTAINAVEAITNVLCYGSVTGAIDMTVSGGTAPYIYSWSNGEATEVIMNLAAGIYDVTVIDANMCEYLGSYSVSEPTAIMVTEVVGEVICNGGATGSINLDVSGGVTPYIYAWSNGAATEDLSNLSAGTYDITITDANGCTYYDSYSITEPDPLVATETITNVLCNGSQTGSIELSVMGGVAPYTFDWSNGSSSEDIAGVAAGTYDVTVTDANMCEYYGNYSLTEPAAIAVTGAVSDVLCFGDATGAVDLTVSGGVAPFIFEWSNSAVSEDLSGLVAGTYEVTITDANSCVWMGPYTVNEPVALAYSEVITDVLCAGSATGAIDLTVSGGTMQYTYLWSNGSTVEDLAGVVAGSYTVLITDANGCILDLAFTISEPVILSVTENSIGVTCFGGADGSIEIVPAGGVSPYTIEWADNTTTFIMSNLSGGTYNYTLTDANMCEYYGSAVVVEPGLFGASGTVSDVSCFGGNDGSVDLSVVGGTSPFTYLWSDGSTDEDLMAIAGTYDVSVTDINGCFTSASFTLNQPVAIVSTGIIIDAMIYGGNQGAIDITVSGGFSPFSFTWSNGASTEDISGLLADDYFVTITDANNCSTIDTYTVGEPAPLSGSGIVSDFNGYGVSCFGSMNGSIDLTILGGTPPYEYIWSNGETTEDLAGLAAGTYDVTASYIYGTGPTGTAFDWTYFVTGANHTIYIPDAQINGTSLVAGDVVGVFYYDSSSVLQCGGYVEWTGVSGGIAITAWGAESGMDNGFQDGEEFIWKVWRAADQQTIDLTAVYAPFFPNLGLYSTNGISGLVTLTGTSSFFSVSEEVLLSFTVTEPAEIILTASTTDVLCFGDLSGAIDLTVTGGVTPFQFDWSTGAITEDISGLASGMYSVTATDANLCQIIEMFEIFENDLLEVSGTVADVNCNGGSDGSINITVMGGTIDYSFLWSNGETTEDLANLAIGTYDVTVSDANNCMAYETYVVGQPAMLTESAVTTAATCYGSNNGAIDLTIQGGMAPYAFAWSNGATTKDLSGLLAGTYSFTVTDANACVISGSYTVSQSASLVLSSSIAHATCNSYQNASINLTVSGGTAPYTYNWSNGATTEDISGLGAAGYIVNVSDVNGCNASALYFVNQPAAISISGTVQNVTCNGLTNGAIDASVTGGTATYSYLWSNSATTQDITGLGAGNYIVTVSDVNGCSKNKTFTVTQPTPLVVTSVKTNVNCNGANNGSVDQTVTGGTAPYVYNWSNGGTTQDIINLAPGTYTATITDSKGCSIINTYIISEPLALTATGYVSSYGAYNVSSYGAANGHIVLSPQGGTSPYLYMWDNGATTYYRLALTAGTYNVTITDLNGCTLSQSFTLTQAPAYMPVTIIPTVINPSCNGYANGAINLTISNGVLPYSYFWSNGSSTKNIAGLIAGTYTVSVVDGANNLVSLPVTVSEPDAIGATYVVTNATCYGMASGSIDLSVTGGTAPYAYNWGFSQAQDVSSLVAGVYTVTIMDAQFCTLVESITVTQSDMIALAFSVTDPLCADDGSVDLSVSGGVAPFTYLWSDGSTDEDPGNLMMGTYSVEVVDANGCVATGDAIISAASLFYISLAATDITCYGAHNGIADLTITGGVTPYAVLWGDNSTDEDRLNLAAGTFSVSVTDGNGCEETGSVMVSEPTEVILSESITNVTCNGGLNGSISVSVTGGIMPYAFIWGNGATSQNLSNLSAGTYMLTVSDANGCLKVGSYTVSEPAPIAMSYASTMVTCYKAKDGTIDITVTGGTSPYTYLWSNLAATEDLSALKPGIYNVKIIDANGCLFISPWITITQPNAFSNSISLAQGILCNGDQNAALNLTVSGGSVPYSYNWNSGAYSTGNISGIGAGAYNVVVTDANGCVTTGSITVSAPNAFSNQVFVNNVTCAGDANGAAAIVLNGGTFPFSFEWSNALAVIGNNEVIFSQPSGVYTVTATDANGCTTTNTATILEPNPIAVNFTYFGVATYTMLANVSGGTAPYTFNWQPGGVTAPFIKNVVPGSTITLTVTDSNGCIFTTTFVAQSAPPTIASSSTNTANQNSDGSINQISMEELTLVYPNPNNTGLFFVSVPDVEVIATMKVYDAMGRMVISDYQKNDSNQSIHLDIKNVSKGIYYLRISDTTNKVVVKKLIVTQ